ncbi:modulator of macroautophagy TMEM150B isoform X3 [Narcine bancroftii]
MWIWALLPVLLAAFAIGGIWAVFSMAVVNGSVNITVEFPYISVCGAEPPQSCLFAQIMNIGAFLDRQPDSRPPVGCLPLFLHWEPLLLAAGRVNIQGPTKARGQVDRTCADRPQLLMYSQSHPVGAAAPVGGTHRCCHLRVGGRDDPALPLRPLRCGLRAHRWAVLPRHAGEGSHAELDHHPGTVASTGNQRFDAFHLPRSVDFKVPQDCLPTLSKHHYVLPRSLEGYFTPLT